jgi:hypothetical protein
MTIRRKPITSLGEINLLPEDKRFWKSWEKRVVTAGKQVKSYTGKHEPREVEVDFSIFTPKDYLLSHCTIVAGVEPEANKYWIVPSHSKWINENGNAWLNQVLLESYHSFIMAENYLEHIQVKELSKGKILDAVAWVMTNDEKGRKEPVPTVFIDILVATDKRQHPTLVNKILEKKITTMSMGCTVTHSQCSKCGKIFRDGEEQCNHLSEQLGDYFRDPNGVKRRVAELCGVPDLEVRYLEMVKSNVIIYQSN